MKIHSDHKHHSLPSNPEKSEYQDVLKLFLKDHINDSEVLNVLIRVSFDSGISMGEAFKLIKGGVDHLLHKPTEKQLKKLESIDLLIKEGEKGKEIFYQLVQDIKSGKITNVKQHMEDGLKSLTLFLCSIHGKMLLDHPESVNKESYKEVKKGFRDILLALERESKSPLLRHTLYNPLKHRYVEDEPSLKGLHQVFANMDSFSHKSPIQLHQLSDLQDLQRLIDEIKHFRRDYLMRYSLDKVCKFVESRVRWWDPSLWLARLTSGGFTDKDVSSYQKMQARALSIDMRDPALLSLLPTTFLHGTQALVLPKLELTGLRLVPTGRLVKMGIAPAGGEVRNGVKPEGVNNFHLSGTDLAAGPTALSYSLSQFLMKTAEQHHQENFSQDDIAKSISTQLEQIERISFPIKSPIFINTIAENLSNLKISVLRYRGLVETEGSFLETPLGKRLMVTLELLEIEFSNFFGSEQYKKYMPKSLDPDGTLGYGWHDSYYLPYLEDCKQGLPLLRSVLTTPVQRVASNSDEPIFPIVFGSKTVNPKLLSPQERLSGSVELGKDIQFIFANKADLDEVRRYLEGKNLEGDVEVVDLKYLEKAIVTEWLAKEYLYDIASEKKAKSRVIAQTST